jgi:hypothetical protein
MSERLAESKDKLHDFASSAAYELAGVLFIMTRYHL